MSPIISDAVLGILHTLFSALFQLLLNKALKKPKHFISTGIKTSFAVIRCTVFPRHLFGH